MSGELVKIGLPKKQADDQRRVRRIRQILEQHDAAMARLAAATDERLRQAVTGDIADAEPELPLAATS